MMTRICFYALLCKILFA